MPRALGGAGGAGGYGMEDKVWVKELVVQEEQDERCFCNLHPHHT